jgi:hypothetical protein
MNQSFEEFENKRIMKHLFKYLGALLAVVLMGATFAACSEDDDNGSANLGLGIKTFFPTKVVANQPMTINGSGFDGVKEIEFPGGTKVTDFEIVSNEMIRVNAPAGIASDGGTIKVRTADDEAESTLPLTLGHTKISGYSKQEGEKAEGGELITIFGTDLEFINGLELLDADGNTQFIDHNDFYRKGTDNLAFRVPLKNIYKGTFAGKVYTYDGQSFTMPEFAYEPNTGGGHWETQENTIWDTETVFDGWSVSFLIGPEQFANVQEGDIIRVYIKDKGGDYNPIFKHDDWSDWNELQSIKVEGDGYFESTVTAAIIDELQTKGLRFQGVGFTITKVTLIQNVWIPGGGVADIVSTIWDTETVFDGWSVSFLIGPEQFADLQEGDLIRVYIKDKGGDYNPIFKHDDWSDWTELQSIKVDGDGYFESTVSAAIIDELQTKGLRFQGVGFTITKVELTMYARPTGGGGGARTTATIWDTETVFDGWSVSFVIGADQFADVQEGDIIRVYIKDKTGDYNPIYKHDDWSDWTDIQSNKVDTDDYFEAPVPASAVDELKSIGLRFQGVGFTITKVELIPGS